MHCTDSMIVLSSTLAQERRTNLCVCRGYSEPLLVEPLLVEPGEALSLPGCGVVIVCAMILSVQPSSQQIFLGLHKAVLQRRQVKETSFKHQRHYMPPATGHSRKLDQAKCGLKCMPF
jgi:hypothetical protein